MSKRVTPKSTKTAVGSKNIALSAKKSGKSPKRKKRGPISLLFSFITKVVLFCVLGSILLVTIFRFVPVPCSAYMIETKIRCLVEGKNSHIEYRWIPIKKMAPYLPNAVIASEDQQFLDHHGFDFKAITKAIKYNNSSTAKKRGKKKGASTISQQVAKNMFLWSDRSWVRKGAEVWFTLLIEVIWPKKRIMEVYLNTAQMGKNLFGVEAASQTYFRKSAKNVTRSQAALIAASLPNPVRFQIANPSGYMYKKQSWILSQMYRLKRQGVYAELMSKKW